MDSRGAAILSGLTLLAPVVGGEATAAEPPLVELLAAYTGFRHAGVSTHEELRVQEQEPR